VEYFLNETSTIWGIYREQIQENPKNSAFFHHFPIYPPQKDISRMASPPKMTSLGPEMGYTPRCNGKGTLWLLNITMENGPFTMGLHWYIPCKSVMLYIVILSYIVLTPILQGYGL
jgi:hypothetical protein